MTRGLVIGKFLPVHNGHIALIRFAATHCDELIVSMSYRDDDPIDPNLRFDWLKEIFADDGNILIRIIRDDFDNEELDWPARTRIWAEVIRSTYPRIDILVSSEEYGAHFAGSLGVKNVLYDHGRGITPVSASRIRESPLRFWEFIPKQARPYFVKKICFYGPESTGKSVMTELMAKKYNTVFVPEVARELIVTNAFSADDIITIALHHYERIQQKIKDANRFLFVDTDVITTKIYSYHYLHTVPDVLNEFESKIHFDHYFLFDIDVPWVPDGLRDLPHRRQEMFNLFKHNLEVRHIPFTVVRGAWQEREDVISRKINQLLESS
jgi:HTH-type transcriptional regulator, transcriptional repressor of NAD biosynthesis genes